MVVALADPQAIRFSILDDDYPLSTRESMALVDRGQNGFGTLDSVVVPVDGQSTEAPAHVLEGDVRYTTVYEFESEAVPESAAWDHQREHSSPRSAAMRDAMTMAMGSPGVYRRI